MSTGECAVSLSPQSHTLQALFLSLVLPFSVLLTAGCSLPPGTVTVSPEASLAFMESFMQKVVDGRCEEAFGDFDIGSLVIYGRPQGSFYRELPAELQARYRKDFCEGIYAGLFRNRPAGEARYALEVSPVRPEVVEISEKTGRKKILFLLAPYGRELKIVRIEKGIPPGALGAEAPRELEVCSPACPFSRIQDAILAADDGDTILVHDGTYRENLDFLGKEITLVSQGGAEKTFIRGREAPGGESGSVVTFPPDEGRGAAIDGFTISGGTGSRVMSVTGLLFGSDREDVGTFGGGISCVDSSPVIRNCVISGNTAGNGGGVSAWRSGPLIENTVISGNRAFRDGGGVYTASFGDGMVNASLVNTTVSGNAAARRGGGVSCYWSSPVIFNSILSGNTTAGEAGSIRQCGRGARTAYSIIEDGGWGLMDPGGSWPGKGNLKKNPLFRGARPAGEAPTTEGDYRPLAGSPSIDGGEEGGPSRDLPGVSRPQGRGYDMGAYEYAPGDDATEPLPGNSPGGGR